MSVNPGLPLLLALSLLPLLVRRRGFGVAFAAVGLAGTLLLASALLLPTGVPSSGAELAHYPPWQGIAKPSGGNPNLRDVVFQVEPWLLFLRHEVRAGRLPFWNPHQFAGAPFWANGQSAPLFPFHLLFAALPLQLGLILLPWLRVVAGGLGCWRLARELGRSRGGALLAALVYPLSGMLVGFLLYPMGNALALVPWVFVAVERLAAGRRGWLLLGVAGGLQLLGGHPETALLTALLAIVYLLARGTSEPRRCWTGLAAGWASAGALAAVQLLPLALNLLRSTKWSEWSPPQPLPASVLISHALRLLLPQAMGSPVDGSWWGPFNYAATAVYAGALTLPLAVAGAARWSRDRRARGLAVATLFALAAVYQLPVLRELLYLLPVLQHTLHHYLKFGVGLGLALLAAFGWDSWRRGEERGLVAGGVATALLAVAGSVWFYREWQSRGLLAGELAWVGWVALAGLLAAAASRLPTSRRGRLLPLAGLLLASDLLAAHGRLTPGLPLSALYPETGAVRFLAGRTERVTGVEGALRPNAAMVYGLYDLRGDDPVKLARFERLYRHLAPGDPVYFRPISTWDGEVLDRLSVRWVVAAPGSPSPVPGWRLAYDGPDARILERPGWKPMVRWDGREADGSLEVTARTSGRWVVRWQAPEPATLVVGEVWDPGWRITEGTGALRPDGDLLGIDLPAGEGRLEIRYRPQGIVPGAALSLLALVALGAAGGRRRAA